MNHIKFSLLISVFLINGLFDKQMMACGGILDLLSFDIMENREAENRGDNNVENLINDQKNFSQCHCTGPICVCCTDFNMTFIDLGKTCVKIHYISQKEGVNLNLTYGDSSLKTVNNSNFEEPFCLSMFASLAQMCTRFLQLVPSSNGGLKGCMVLEPKLLGETQIELSLGCFDMNVEEIKLIETPKKSTEIQESSVVEATEEANREDIINAGNATASMNEETIAGFKVADILNVVSKTADQGISIISNWFGINSEEEKDPESLESKTTENINATQAV